MSWKSFLLGVVTGAVTGAVLTFVVFLIIGVVHQNSTGNDPVKYLEQPVSYEGKTETSFKVFQVLGDAALADEVSNKGLEWYDGNTVLILGENFYSHQIVTVKNPMRVGTYSYTNKAEMPMTVPVIDGEMK